MALILDGRWSLISGRSTELSAALRYSLCICWLWRYISGSEHQQHMITRPSTDDWDCRTPNAKTTDNNRDEEIYPHAYSYWKIVGWAQSERRLATLRQLGVAWLVVFLFHLTSHYARAENAIVFGTFADSSYFVLDCGVVHGVNAAERAFYGVVLRPADRPSPDFLSLQFDVHASDRMRPLRWRVQKNILWAALIGVDLELAKPGPHRIVGHLLEDKQVPGDDRWRAFRTSTLRRSRQPFSAGGETDAGIGVAKWKTPTNTGPMLDLELFTDRVATGTAGLYGGTGFLPPGERRILANVAPIENAEAKLQSEGQAFYDIWFSSVNEPQLIVSSLGILERWKPVFFELPPDPRMPKMPDRSLHRLEWHSLGVSWLGVNKPFRIVRADSEMILLTDDGFIICHSPDHAHPVESKTRVLDEKALVLLEAEDASFVFSSDRYLAVPKSGKYALTWKPLFPELKATDIPVADPVRQVQFLKKLTESVMGK